MSLEISTPAALDNSTTFQASDLYREPITRRTATIILLLAPVVFAAPIMLAGYSLMPRADMDGTLGLHLIVGRNIAEGALPFLNPYMLSAQMLFSTIYSGALYPPSWLFALLSPATSTDIFVITSFYIALFGSYLFGRRTGMSRFGAIISAAAFTFGVLGGLSAVGVGNSSSVASAAWIPWVMLAIECIAQKARPRWVLLGGAFLALQVFAGDLQICLLTGLTALAYIFFRNKQGARNDLFMTGATIMMIGGALLAMTLLIPIREKFLAGSSDLIVGESLPTSDMFPARIPILAYLWISAAFAVIIGVRSRRAEQSLTIFLATAAAITLSIASMTPEVLERTLYWIPIYGLFQSSAIPLFISGFTVAALMGLAISRFPDLRNNVILRQVAAIALLSAIPMILAFSANLRPDRSRTEIYNRLQDPPAVQFIKSREKDLNSFRVLKYDLAPNQQKKELGADPTRAITPGLRYVNGARESAQPWIAALAGDLNDRGEITNRELFNPSHQGLDLLGIKYVLIQNEPELKAENDLMEIDGVRFLKDNLGLRISPGNRADIKISPSAASEMVFISNMGGGAELTDGATICDVKLHTKDGRILTQKIQAGRDTSEWCYDYPVLANKIKHQKARVAESYPAGGFSGHFYIGRLPFDRGEITRIEMDRAESADFLIIRLALYDSETRKSTPVTPQDVLTHHLQKIGQFGDVGVYQNDNYRPLGWFAKRVVTQTFPEILNTIKSGCLPDSSKYSKFDLSETALIDKGNPRAEEINIPAGGDAASPSVTILSQSARGLELTTQNDQPGLLVLNVPYERGLTARIDGRPQRIERVDFALSGIAMPAGTHRIDVTFGLPRAGKIATYFFLGLLTLSLAVPVYRLKRGNARRLSPAFILRVRGACGRFVERCKSPARSALKHLRKIDSSKLATAIGLTGLIIYGSVMISRTGYGLGGADSYGYGSLAKMISQFKATESIKELAEFNLSPDYSDLFVPPSFLRSPKPGILSNMYPIGLPLMMAAASAIFGWEIGPFIISPLSATLAILLIYLIGLELGLSRKLSAAGGVLLGIFPTIVEHGLILMSDAPAMFWSTVTIFAALKARKNPHWAIAAGFAFGVAILIRPSNILLLAPIAFALPLSIKSLIRFGLGGLPVAALFFTYNFAAFGSPFKVGYTAVGVHGWFRFVTFTTHLSQFVYWISILMSPTALFFWAATVVNKSVHWRDRAMIISWFAGYYLLYCLYDLKYDYDAHWEYTRFLLPGIPAVVLGFLLTIRRISDLLIVSTGGDSRATGRFVAPLLLLPVFATSVSQIYRYNAYKVGVGMEERKNAARSAGALIPQKSLIVSLEYNGTVKYYLDRYSLRFDFLSPEQWKVVKERADEKGYQFYALLFYDEEPRMAQGKIPGKWTLIDTFYGHTTLWKIDPE